MIGRRDLTRAGAVALALAALTGLAACTSSGGSKSGGQDSTAAQASGASSTPASSPASSSSAAVPEAAAKVTTEAVGGMTKANPGQPVTVKVTDGKLTSVKMVSPAGKIVAGKLAADGSSWQNAEDLGYGKTYSVSVVAQNGDGARTVRNEKVTTLKPDNMTMPYFQSIGGYDMHDGATYGVGMVAIVHFDEPIHDKAAAEKAVTVTTSPHVAGAWYWADDQNAHWRPQSYYKPGTKVTVDAKVYGVELGKGLYGQADKKTSFTIGADFRAVANAKTHHVKVYASGKLVRTMPTSMGQGGYIEGGKIALWTMPGNYTVINHENPAIMSSDSYGLPANSPYGYHGLVVPYATKISIDGIYLHELDSTVGVQGHANVSHGCLNLNQTNAKWYYNHTRTGDVVQVVHSGGPGLQIWQGGDWSVPWSTWVKGGSK